MIDLKEYSLKANLSLSDEMVNQLNCYYELLVEQNKVMNLTAITEYDDVVVKHFIDSLAVINAFDLSKVESVIDVGTGAGFPGLVLKIVFPHLKITLLDSLNKRIKFLNDVITKLKLTNINAIHGRAEDFGHNDLYREKYDLCVSRAVANLSTLSEYCIPFIKKNGFFVSYKAGESNAEIEESKKAIGILGCNIQKVCDYCLPDTDISRKFVVINKVKNTANKFPRKAGLPSKEPIK